MRMLVLLLLVLTRTSYGQIRHAVLQNNPDASFTTVRVDLKEGNRVMVFVSNGDGFTSTDGGTTWDKWKTPDLQSHSFVGVSQDVKGTFYGIWNSTESLQSRYAEVPGGAWSEGSPIQIHAGAAGYFARLNTTSKKEDLLVAWSASNKPGHADCVSSIYFSSSENRGKKWSKPVRLNATDGACTEDGKSLLPAAPVMATDGKIFTVWTGGGSIFIDRSYDGGAMWLSNDLPIGKIKGGNDGYIIPGFGKLLYHPTLQVDNSTSAFQRCLYVMWADQRNGESNTDIFLTRSSNRGDNWTQPFRVNQDTSTRHQFLPGMAIDQANGRLYVAYYDQRRDVADETRVYLAWSVDGGNHFSELQVSDAPFSGGVDRVGPVSVHAFRGLIAVSWIQADGNSRKVITTVLKEADLPQKP